MSLNPVYIRIKLHVSTKFVWEGDASKIVGCASSSDFSEIRIWFVSYTFVSCTYSFFLIVTYYFICSWFGEFWFRIFEFRKYLVINSQYVTCWPQFTNSVIWCYIVLVLTVSVFLWDKSCTQWSLNVSVYHVLQCIELWILHVLLEMDFWKKFDNLSHYYCIPGLLNEGLAVVFRTMRCPHAKMTTMMRQYWKIDWLDIGSRYRYQSFTAAGFRSANYCWGFVVFSFGAPRLSCVTDCLWLVRPMFCDCLCIVAQLLRMWVTSKQLLQSVLMEHGLQQAISLQIFDYQFNVGDSLLSVNVDLNSCRVLQLDPSQARSQKKKKNLKLPFGLKVERKKRNPQKRRRVTTTAKEKADLHDCKLPAHVLQEIEEVVGHGQGHAHDSSSDETSSMSSGDGVSGSDEDSAGEAPLVVPVQKAEELETRQVLESHHSFNADDGSGAVQESDRAPVATPRLLSTQCNMSICICEVSIQKAARLAKCQGCQCKIARYTPRIGYAYSLKKFHSYVHPGCFPAYLKDQNGCVQQAIQFIRDWVRANEDFSGISEIQKMLQVLEGGV